MTVITHFLDELVAIGREKAATADELRGLPPRQASERLQLLDTLEERQCAVEQAVAHYTPATAVDALRQAVVLADYLGDLDPSEPANVASRRLARALVAFLEKEAGVTAAELGMQERLGAVDRAV
jgi:hypothetical protein